MNIWPFTHKKRPFRLYRIMWLCLMLLPFSYSCNKVVEVVLPPYESEIVVEMYLEDRDHLKCLLTESLSYSDSAINRLMNDALVVFSDGKKRDTLEYSLTENRGSGRWYNYSARRVLKADPSAEYTLEVVDASKRKITATTRFPEKAVPIDSIVCLPTARSTGNAERFSIGVAISDPADTDNYYRFLITEKLDDYTSITTDFFVSDVAFNGQSFSYFSDDIYMRGTSVLVRVYSLLKEHYDYLQSAENARVANFNPFVQPSPLQTNIKGGLGIFAAVYYDEKKVIVR